MLDWEPSHTDKAEGWESKTFEDCCIIDAAAGIGGALQLDGPEIESRKPKYTSLQCETMAATASCTGLTP
jgi:hypothetical protein